MTVIEDGPIFRRFAQWGKVDHQAPASQSVNLILRARCRQVV